MSDRKHRTPVKNPKSWSQVLQWKRFIPALLVLTGLACALPFISKPAPTATQPAPSATTSVPPTPTPTPQPLPPALVESDPPKTAELPLNGPITLYFNQDMDHTSVEAALRSQFPGQLAFTWVNNSTVIVSLSAPLPPESPFSVTMSDSMRSAQGKPLLQTISLDYQTASYLAVTQVLPERDAQSIDPTSAVVVSFNRPVVPLGVDPGAAVAAFTLEPAAPGHGEWLNTSTYAFYPDPALDGGKAYTVRINPSLKSVDGGPLRSADSWSFTTSRPHLLSIEPVKENPWPLDPKVVLKFNQPMDRASVEAAFKLSAPGGEPVGGKLEWSDTDTVLTFTPAALLARGSGYTVGLASGASGRGGTPLDNPQNAAVTTVPSLQVTRTDPASGGQTDPTRGPVLYFSAPVKDENLDSYITIQPAVSDLSVFFDPSQNLLRLNGSFTGSTDYTVTVSGSLADPWGGSLGQDFTFAFKTTPFPPNLNLMSLSSMIFLTGQDATLQVQAVNLDTVPMAVGELTLEEFIAMNAPEGYDLRQNLVNRPATTWSQPLILAPDRMQTADLYLSPQSTPLPPGLYFLRFDFPPGSAASSVYSGPFLLVVGNLQVTLKTSATDALAWVTDLRTGAPLANTPIKLYGEKGAVLAEGVTDADGIFAAGFSPQDNPYAAVYAVVGQKGDPNFSMAVSSWSAGIDAWDFGLQSTTDKPGLKAYFYTDRPIYRPGQTVYFRGVLRQASNGRYSPPEVANLPLTVSGGDGQELAALDLPVSPVGTVHGQYTLPPDARPGYYGLQTSVDQSSYLGFQVADYRKPEVNLQAGFPAEAARAGETLSAAINARYFFDAPAGNLAVHWTLSKSTAYFSLPGYRVGREDTSWLEAYRYPSMFGLLGEQVDEGDGRTGADGRLELQFPTQPADILQKYTLEVTVTDETGLPVSSRSSVLLQPDDFVIGIRPDAWVGRAAKPAGFDIQVVDWQKQPAGVRSLRAVFQQVTWKRTEPPASDPFRMPVYTPQYTSVGSTDFTTGPDGQARLAFTPPKPGTYMLDVFDAQTPQDQGARSQLLLWVGGPGEAIWPNLPNSRLQIVADRENYRPGDTAQIFIPNPFGRPVQALLTVERSIIMEHRLITVDAQGYKLELPLTADYAPNVYLSITLLGSDKTGKPDFRQGYLDLPVAPVDQTLNVALTSQPERAGPGDPVTFEIQVTDSSGSPVQGEFSLSVVDLAVLSLADPNSEDIVSAFYKPQPVGVHTSLALAAYNRRMLDLPGGLGGGGGEAAPSVTRENFPDTAYWNAEVTTGPDGRAQVSLNLPDTLTTWQVETRGVTLDTRVGDATSQVVATKDLIVRPVTPRFFVANDHVELAAVVQNNTSQDLPVQAALQANGFTLDDPGAQTQTVQVPAQGRAQVAWWGTVQDVENVDLVFSAGSGNYLDAARPAAGALPVLRYYAPQAFRTAGVLDAGGEIVELVSLPRSFEPGSGRLNVDLSPSLAAAVIRGLDVLEAYPVESTEAAISSFLPNLETYRTLKDFNISDDNLMAKLNTNLNTELQRLLARQNYDGGWAWQEGGSSDAFITSYVLYGLLRAKQSGIAIPPNTIQRAIDYFQAASQPAQGGEAGGADTPQAPPQPWQWDRLAFQQFVLSEAGSVDAAALDKIVQAKDQLSPWAQALLALTLDRQSRSEEAQTILSDLQGKAVRSATGAFWEMPQDESGLLASGYNMQSDLSNTAIVLFVLAQRDPASPLVADALRYLMANRGADGAWSSTYTTAWSLVAANAVMKGTGELAGSFSYGAILNGAPLAQGQSTGGKQVTQVTAETPVGRLYPNYPNSLSIRRTDGPGRLYYTVGLEVSRPVDDISPLSEGLSIQRAFYPFGEDACPQGQCPAIQSASAGQKVTVRLSLTLEHDAYFLAVSDYIPSGAEILNTALKTSQLGEGSETTTQVVYDPRRPYAQGWGWWLFDAPQVYDDHIVWTAQHLAAGSYELTYTLVLLQAGQFRVLPARAWQIYFPEVQANSAGAVFEIKP